MIFYYNPLQKDWRHRTKTDNKDRWPNNTVYYEIDPNLYNKSELPDQSRITVAIQEIEYNTNIRFVKHTTESNYVKFIYNANGCSSSVGMIGGMQKIRLADWATKGNVIHEICHALGLLHEHNMLLLSKTILNC